MRIVFYVAYIGKTFLIFLTKLGRFTMFTWKILSHVISGPFYPKIFVNQLINIGFLSLPVVGLTTIFTGAALALQIYSGGTRFNAESVVPSIVAIGICRELGPVLCGLIIAGRVASSISAEIGTMKVTEQIDALYTLNTNPYNFLIIPRVLACFISLPFLTLIGDILGIMGGFFVGVSTLEFNATNYLLNTVKFLEIADIISGLIKAGFFGLIIGVLGTFHGLHTEVGAKGVGKATINSVVWSSISVLAANYILTEALFYK
ncbi:ABC transporter permease [Paracoccaceae bacterium]|nr:ABC transporter permease [Paracoccaceae bacterium]